MIGLGEAGGLGLHSLAQLDIQLATVAEQGPERWLIDRVVMIMTSRMPAMISIDSG